GPWGPARPRRGRSSKRRSERQRAWAVHGKGARRVIMRTAALRGRAGRSNGGQEGKGARGRHSPPSCTLAGVSDTGAILNVVYIRSHIVIGGEYGGGHGGRRSGNPGHRGRPGRGAGLVVGAVPGGRHTGRAGRGPGGGEAVPNPGPG